MVLLLHLTQHSIAILNVIYFKMQVKDKSLNDVLTKRFDSPLLLRSIRGLIIGKSGCGKTNLILNLLLEPRWLDYNKLHVFGKALYQPEYRIIKKAFEEKLHKEQMDMLIDNYDKVIRLDVSPLIIIKEMAKDLNRPEDIECKFFENSDDVLDLGDLDRTKKNLMIFDDLMLEKQNKCKEYYTMS